MDEAAFSSLWPLVGPADGALAMSGWRTRDFRAKQRDLAGDSPRGLGRIPVLPKLDSFELAAPRPSWSRIDPRNERHRRPRSPRRRWEMTHVGAW
jgi:hypothetical protein